MGSSAKFCKAAFINPRAKWSKALDSADRKISTMGNPTANDGSIERADINGKNLMTIVPAGGTFTPKQLQLDKANGKLYWSDREGMRVMRANLDGSDIETLVETGHGEADRRDARNWCIGIALDVKGGRIYWTQKGPDNAGQGCIFRANLEIPKGQTPANRKDIELLFDANQERKDGSHTHAAVNKKTLLFAQGNLTGIAYAKLPARGCFPTDPSTSS